MQVQVQNVFPYSVQDTLLWIDWNEFGYSISISSISSISSRIRVEGKHNAWSRPVLTRLMELVNAGQES